MPYRNFSLILVNIFNNNCRRREGKGRRQDACPQPPRLRLLPAGHQGRFQTLSGRHRRTESGVCVFVCMHVSRVRYCLHACACARCVHEGPTPTIPLERNPPVSIIRFHPSATSLTPLRRAGGAPLRGLCSLKSIYKIRSPELSKNWPSLLFGNIQVRNK